MERANVAKTTPCGGRTAEHSERRQRRQRRQRPEHPRISFVTVDHRAYTEGDTELITDLPKAEQETVFKWIRLNLLPASKELEGRSSYGIKHIMNHDTGIYVTNNQFKDAMLMCGFEPNHFGELNWMYRLDRLSPAFLMRRLAWYPNAKPAAANDSEACPCFYHWVKKYRTEDSARGTFARDCSQNQYFYAINNKPELLNYLINTGACKKAIVAFKLCWAEYERALGDEKIKRAFVSESMALLD